MAQDFSPTEIFKRATAATLRAIAERDDVTIGFGPEAAGLSGTRVRLPNPPRDLPAEEAAQLRGAADSMALRLRYHDAAVHSRRLPGSPLARAVFEAVEQARVEALGSRRMVGVAGNLAAVLDEQYRRQGFERITERTESTMAEAVRLLTREALTKERPPPSARRVVDLWRPWLEAKIAKDLGELDRAILDQDEYARATRRMLQDLDIDLGEAEDSESDEQQEGEEAEGENQSEGEGATTGAQPSPDGSPADGEAEDAQDAAEAGDGEMMPGSSDDDPGRPGRPGTMPRGRPDDTAIYRAFSTVSDEVVEADQLCDADELSRLRQLLDQQLAHSAERHRAPCQPPAAQAHGQADPRLGVRPRRGPARCRAAVAGRRQPGPAARLQARARDRFPRHRRQPVDRQFGLDARPADHRRGDERRHPGAHPRTLRGQGRDPRLHHPRVEGRPGARALDRRRQAAPTPAGSTICGTSSTSPPTRPGAAPGAISG